MISKQLSQLYEVKPLSKIVEKKCYYNGKIFENISDCLEEIEEKVKMLDNYLKPNHRKTKEHIHFKERISEINGL